MMSTDIPWVHFQEKSLSMVHLNLSFSFDDVFSSLVLGDPVAIDITDAQTEVHYVG